MSQLTKEKQITEKDLTNLFWRWVFFQESSVSYERLQAPGFLFAQKNILKKLYQDDTEEMTRVCERHMQFYNSEPYFGLAIHGLVVALEEERANGNEVPEEAITNVKTGLMGPLAGIGDTLRAGTLAPIITAFAISFGQEGNLIAPFLLIGLLCLIVLPPARWLLSKSYSAGREGIQEIFQSGIMERIMVFASVLGGVTIGALTASYVRLESTAIISLGPESSINLQTEVFDNILLNILPLGLTLFVVYLLNKNISTTKIILIITAIVVVGCLIGLF